MFGVGVTLVFRLYEIFFGYLLGFFVGFFKDICIGDMGNRVMNKIIFFYKEREIDL